MMRTAARKTLPLLESCALQTERHGKLLSMWTRLRTSRSLSSAAACGQHRSMRGHTQTLAALRKSEPIASETLAPEAPPVDVELVDSIVQVAGPTSMDTATWASIYSETSFPNIWVAESLLASTHEVLGLSWMVALPVTVVAMRTCMAPLHILALREGHKMQKANPLIQDAQKAMMLSVERGASVSDAQQQYVKDVKDIMETHKTGFMSSIYPVFVQLPVFTGYYFALTMMCSHHLPSMVVDSAPFGFDLTISDPFHLAPFACSGTIMMAMYMSMSQRWKMLAPAQQQMAKYGAFIAPPVLTAAFWSFPSALCYYWTCSNVYTIVRAAVGLPSIAEQTELMLMAQKRNAIGGQPNMFDMYKRTAEAANQQSAQEAQRLVSAAKPDTSHPVQVIPPSKPAEAPPKMIAIQKFKKKGRV